MYVMANATFAKTKIGKNSAKLCAVSNSINYECIFTNLG